MTKLYKKDFEEIARIIRDNTKYIDGVAIIYRGDFIIELSEYLKTTNTAFNKGEFFTKSIKR